MYTKEVTIDMADIFMVLMDYQYNHPDTTVTMYKFEHLVQQVVRPQVDQCITLADFTLYVGAIATLLWTNRDEWYNNTPLALTVKQHKNGCFSSKLLYI